MKSDKQSEREHPKKNSSIGTQNTQPVPPPNPADNGACGVGRSFKRQSELAGIAYNQQGDKHKNLLDNDDDEQGGVDPDEIDEALSNRPSRPD